MRRFFLLTPLLLLAACAGAPSDPLSGDAAHVHGVQAVDMSGQTHVMDEVLNGQRGAVLVFWQEWCSSCLEEAPLVERESQQRGSDYAFYGVVSGKKDAQAEDRLEWSVQQLNLSYPQLRDVDGSISSRYAVSSTPTILVFNAAGELTYRGAHLPADWSGLK